MLQKWFEKLTRSGVAREQNTATALQEQPTTGGRPDPARVVQQFEALVLGQPRPKPLTVPEKLVVQVVEEQCRDIEKRQAAVPRLPNVIPMLLKSLRDPNSSAQHYVDIIKQDPVLAASVLKVANSAYFNTSGNKVTSFERAVVALGIDGMRSVLSTAVMQPILQRQGADVFGKRVWDHALATAVCCQAYAPSRGCDSFKAYLLGLVADVGAITLYTLLAQQGKQHLEGAKVDARLLKLLLEKMATPLSYWVASDWHLPQEMISALAEQETAPGKALSPLGESLRYSQLISKAYLLARHDRIEVDEVGHTADALAFPGDAVAILDSMFDDSGL